MTDASLTTKQRDLLQRWFDGELAEDRVPEAEALIEDSPAAADYVASLGSMRQITRGLADEARGGPGWSVEETVSKAIDAPPAADEPLRELAPLLERYHDDEVVEAEAALVRRLRRRRDDVGDYLDALEQLGDAVRAADGASREGVDFDRQVGSILEEIERKDGVELPEFDATRHTEWLHRYADDELDAERSRIVEGWIENDHPDVVDCLRSLNFVGDSTRAAFDEAETDADVDLWEGIAAELNDESDEIDGEVAASEGAEESADVYWLDDYRQGIAGAVAAALVLITVGALLGDRVLPWGERVVEKKTVVIVDSVEHSKGSSVMIDSPMQQTGASDSADGRDTSQRGDAQSSGDEPTVIWLLDSKNKDGASGSDDSQKQKTAPEPDAGSSDADPRPSGQPI